MSSYSRDPGVPPARVGHLGKHRPAEPHGPVGLPAAHEAAPATPEPTYADFLEGTAEAEGLGGQTG